MARPKLPLEQKWANLEARFKRDVIVKGEDECWPMNEPQHYYTLGSTERFRPKTLAWLLADRARVLPQPRHIFYIGNRDGCEATCVNPRHLEIKANTPGDKSASPKEEPVIFAERLPGQIPNPKGPGHHPAYVWESIEAYERYERSRHGGDPNFKYVPKNAR